EKVRRWQRPARYLAVPGFVLLLLSATLLFFFKNTDWNFMIGLIEAIDSIEYDSLKSIFSTLIYVVVFGGIGTSVWMIYHYYLNDSKITEVKNNFRQDIREKM